jgi:hypothetical protein
VSVSPEKELDNENKETVFKNAFESNNTREPSRAPNHACMETDGIYAGTASHDHCRAPLVFCAFAGAARALGSPFSRYSAGVMPSTLAGSDDDDEQPVATIGP